MFLHPCRIPIGISTWILHLPERRHWLISLELVPQLHIFLLNALNFKKNNSYCNLDSMPTFFLWRYLSFQSSFLFFSLVIWMVKFCSMFFAILFDLHLIMRLSSIYCLKASLINCWCWFSFWYHESYKIYLRYLHVTELLCDWTG